MLFRIRLFFIKELIIVVIYVELCVYEFGYFGVVININDLKLFWLFNYYYYYF